jgi:hypothetical protein
MSNEKRKIRIFAKFIRKASSSIRNVYDKEDFMDEQYYDIERRTAVKDTARELRRKFLRYKDAEVVYSMTHKKLLELAGKAGAIYRIDGYVLLDRDIFDEYLEQFHEPATE